MVTPDGKHGMLAFLRSFFEAVEADTRDTRFNNPEYLAAKFVVYTAGLLSQVSKPLDFLGVGLCVRDHGDIEFIYTVDCSNLDDKGRPRVTCADTSR